MTAMVDESWSKHVADILRRNDIRLFATVPDYIVSHVFEHLWADAECRVVTVTREEEGVGLLAGAWLGGKRGGILMQNSGLGNCANALASLCAASLIPIVLVISHRGDPRRPRHSLDQALVDRGAGGAGRRAHQARVHALAHGRLRAAARSHGRQDSRRFMEALAAR